LRSSNDRTRRFDMPKKGHSEEQIIALKQCERGEKVAHVLP